MLPSRSLLTGVNALEPRTSDDRQVLIRILHFLDESMTVNLPNKVVRDSAASRDSVVETPLSLAASIGTSTKDFLMVSNQVDIMI